MSSGNWQLSCLGLNVFTNMAKVILYIILCDMITHPCPSFDSGFDKPPVNLGTMRNYSSLFIWTQSHIHDI